MEIKNFNTQTCLTAFVCAGGAVAAFYMADIRAPLYILYLPVEWAGDLLRWMSLRSGAGNAAAWVMYAVICLIPVIYMVLSGGFRLRRRADILLILLSVYMFYLLYAFINPAVMGKLFPQAGWSGQEELEVVMKNILAGMAYSIMAGYVILRFAGSFKTTDIWKQMEMILLIGTVGYIAFVCYVLPFRVFTSFESSLQSASVISVLAGFFLDLLPMACFVGIMESGVLMVQALREDKYSGAAVKAAALMADRSRRTVIVSVICNIANNLINLIFGGAAMKMDLFFNIPFIPLILAFIGLLAAEYIKESSLLHDDNKMII